MRLGRVWVANRALFANAGSLVGSTVVTSGLGFVYWWLAAREFAPEAVGFAAAAVSTMSLLGTVGMLGLGTLLIHELPRHGGRERPLMTAAVSVAGAAGGVLGALFAEFTGWLVPNLEPLGTSAVTVALFGAGVALTSVALVVDQGTIGLLRGELQLVRNAAFAVVKLAALFVCGLVFATDSWLVIYGTFVVGLLLSLAGLGALPSWRVGTAGPLRPWWGGLRGLGRASLAHHSLNLALQAPLLVLPVVVTAQLSAAMAAYFYTASMIAGFVFVGPVALTTVLYADGMRSPGALASKTRLTLALAAGGGGVAFVGLLLVGRSVLGAFGPGYAEMATESLWIMGLAVFPLIVKDHYVAICRIQGRIAGAALVVSVGAVMEVAAAAVGATIGGLSGLALAWVVAVCAEAAFITRDVLRVVGPAREATDPGAEAGTTGASALAGDNAPAHVGPR